MAWQEDDQHGTLPQRIPPPVLLVTPWVLPVDQDTLLAVLEALKRL